MTFAAINWLNISIDILLLIFVIVCLLMTLLILMQRPKQEGLGAAFGGGVTDQVFGARTTNVLQRGTVYLGSLFFILALTLSVLIGHQNKQKKLVVDQKPATTAEVAAPEKPKEVTAPKSLSEELPDNTTKPAETPSDAPADASVPATKAVAPAVVAPPAEVTPPVEVTPPAETAPDQAQESKPEETAPPKDEIPAPAEEEAPKDN